MDDSTTTAGNDQKWYVLEANFRKEIAVRDELRARGFEAYVPMRYVLAAVKGRRQRMLRPAIHGLVFVRGTEASLFDYKHTSRNNQYIFFRTMREGSAYRPVVVRDAEMRNFMRLTEMSDVRLGFYRPDELRLAPGQKVKIVDGIFKDIEGVVMRLPHRQGDYLVVEIPGVSVVAASIKPDYVQPVGRKVAPSANVEADVRRLMDLAGTLLYDLPAAAGSEAARRAVVSEVLTLRDALAGSKTFMPADRAAYMLAHYLAGKALGEPVGGMLGDLRALAAKLRGSSMLRMRVCLYLGTDAGDAEAMEYVAESVAKWDAGSLTDTQRQFVKERQQAEHGATAARGA